MKRKWTRRFGLYLGGLVALALGTALGIRAQLGVNATATTGYVLSEVSGLSIGACTAIFFALFVAAQLVLSPTGNRRLILAQLPFGLFFAITLDAVLSVLAIPADAVWQKATLLLTSLLVTAVGVFLTVRTGFVPTPPDGLTDTIARRYGFPFGNVKLAFDVTCVVLSAITALVFCGTPTGIGVGTLVSALLTGPIVKGLEIVWERNARQ